MEKKQEKLVIVVNESLPASIIKDVFTFLIFGGLLWFNHKYLAGSGWVDMAFILFVFLWLAGRNSSKAYSGPRAGAIKWLQDKE